MNQRNNFSQFDIEKNGSSIVGRPITEGYTLDQVFGPIDNWLLQLGPYHLLYLPIQDRWLYWDWVHEAWQDTGHKAFEVEFHLDGDQVLAQPVKAKAYPAQDLAQRTFAQHSTPLPEEVHPIPEAPSSEVESTAVVHATAQVTAEPAPEPVVNVHPSTEPPLTPAREPIRIAPEVALPVPVEPATDSDEGKMQPLLYEVVHDAAEEQSPSAKGIEPVVAAEPSLGVVESAVVEDSKAVVPPLPSEPLPAVAFPVQAEKAAPPVSPPIPKEPLPPVAPSAGTAPLKQPAVQTGGQPASTSPGTEDHPVAPQPRRTADEFAATMLYKRPVVWELRVIEGLQAPIVYRLKPLTTIGRASDNVISLDDPMASRHHARLEWAGDFYLVTDLGSSNGTFVNDKKINAPTQLDEGSQLMVGQTRFIVQKREE
jgi:hypothetical protein